MLIDILVVLRWSCAVGITLGPVYGPRCHNDGYSALILLVSARRRRRLVKSLSAIYSVNKLSTRIMSTK